MMAVLQAYDGRIKGTMLADRVLEHFGTSDVLEMVFQASQGLVRATDADQVGILPDSGSGEVPVGGVFFHRRARNEPLTRYEVATLCPVVEEVARQGDWKAIEILKEAGYELGRLGVAIITSLGMVNDEFAVVPFGGVFRAGELVLGSFGETILTVAPGAVIVKPKFEPAVGAVLLALRELGVVISGQVIRAVEQTSSGISACRVR
jgi:N-acetylglucosamine kinase-like BadF-type ATPase